MNGFSIYEQASLPICLGSTSCLCSSLFSCSNLAFPLQIFPSSTFYPQFFAPALRFQSFFSPPLKDKMADLLSRCPLHLANRSNHLICNCLLFNYLLLLTGMIGSYIRTELFFLLLQFLPGIPFLSMLSKGRRKKLPRVPKSAHFAQKCPEVFFCFGAQPESIYSYP